MKVTRHCKKACLLAAWTFFSFYSPVHAQPAANTFTLPGIYTHSFISAINGQPYQLTIALPLGYSSTDTLPYKVLYLLDGDPDLPLAALIQRDMSYGHEVPDMIMVGIGYQVADFLASRPFRTLDYTPTHVPTIDSIMTANHHLNMVSGGAGKFLRVIKEEIIPFIDHTYRTNQDRALAGHSFGGLFVAWQISEQIFLNETHLSVLPFALSRGLRAIYR